MVFLRICRIEEALLNSLMLTFNFLKYSIPGLIIGVFIAELLVEKGIVEKTKFISKPFIKFSNLPDECALSFIIAFISGRGASAMLVDLYREGRIDRKELYIASLMNAFPVMVRHWYSMLPILVAILGGLGLLYFGTLLLISFIQTAIFAFIGKILIKKPVIQDSHNSTIVIKGEGHPIFLKKSLSNILKNMRKHLIPILKSVIIVTYITSLLIVFGFFDSLTSIIRKWAIGLPFSIEEISVAITFIACRVAAYTLGANLIGSKLIDSITLIRALLLGSLLSNVTALKWLIPYYIGIYGAKDGSRIMLFSITVRSIVIFLFIFIFGVIL